MKFKRILKENKIETSADIVEKQKDKTIEQSIEDERKENRKVLVKARKVATPKDLPLKGPKSPNKTVTENYSIKLEGYNYKQDKDNFTVNCKTRAELAKLIESLKQNNIKHRISKSITEGYRYDVCFKNKLLKEEVEKHDIKVKGNKIIIDNDEYELLDQNETYYLFVDENGYQQEIRKDGTFDTDESLKEKLNNSFMDNDDYLNAAYDFIDRVLYQNDIIDKDTKEYLYSTLDEKDKREFDYILSDNHIYNKFYNEFEKVLNESLKENNDCTYKYEVHAVDDKDEDKVNKTFTNEQKAVQYAKNSGIKCFIDKVTYCDDEYSDSETIYGPTDLEEDLVLDDGQSEPIESVDNRSKEDKTIDDCITRWEDEDLDDEDVRNQIVLDIIEQLYPDLEAYSEDWDNVYRIYEEKVNCILDGNCNESLKESNNDYIKKQISEIESAIRAGKTSSKYSDLIANYGTIQNARKELKELKDKLKSLKEGYYDNEIEMTRDGEQDDEYVIIEGARDGYGIDQIEDYTMTIGELINYLSDFDDNTKVVIGNDWQRGYYYTYGKINDDSIKTVRIVDGEVNESLNEKKNKQPKPKWNANPEKSAEFIANGTNYNQNLAGTECCEAVEENNENQQNTTFSFPDGTIYYVALENGKLIAGTMLDNDLGRHYEVDYDEDLSYDENLDNLYSEIIENQPSLLDDNFTEDLDNEIELEVVDEEQPEEDTDEELYNLDLDNLEDNIWEDEIPEEFDDQMDYLASDEEEAIDGYKQVIDKVEDKNVKTQLKKIETEEKAHKDFLDKVKENPKAEYVEPLPEENKTEEEEEVVDIEDENGKKVDFKKSAASLKNIKFVNADKKEEIPSNKSEEEIIVDEDEIDDNPISL